MILFQELQADFEGRNPEDSDFHGIKQLLRQLFLKSNVELGGLAQIIICKYTANIITTCVNSVLNSTYVYICTKDSMVD